MRILALGGWYGSGNLGDDAILMGVRRLFRGHEVVALSSDPGQTRRVCGVDAVRLRSPREAIRDQGYIREISGFDACLVTGGTPLYDYDHWSRLLHMLGPALGGRLVFFGVGCKAISSMHGRLLTGFLATRAARVSVRDQYSEGVLAGLGCRAAVTGDSALHMDAAERSLRGAYAVVCPRWLQGDARSQYHDPVDWRVAGIIRRRVAEAADQLAGRGLRVLFVPFHVVNSGRDAEEAELTRSMMREESEVIAPAGPVDAAGVLAGARLVVGLRLHSVILAAARGVPAVSVGYDAKIAGFFGSAGVPWLAAEPWRLNEAVLRALDEREEVSAALTAATSRMKEKVGAEAERVLAHFESPAKSRRRRPSKRMTLTPTP